MPPKPAAAGGIVTSAINSLSTGIVAANGAKHFRCGRIASQNIASRGVSLLMKAFLNLSLGVTNP